MHHHTKVKRKKRARKRKATIATKRNSISRMEKNDTQLRIKLKWMNATFFLQCDRRGCSCEYTYTYKYRHIIWIGFLMLSFHILHPAATSFSRIYSKQQINLQLQFLVIRFMPWHAMPDFHGISLQQCSDEWEKHVANCNIKPNLSEAKGERNQQKRKNVHIKIGV